MKLFYISTVVFVLQWTVGEHFSIHDVAPDLLFCLAVSVAMAGERNRSTMLVCWFLGLLKDTGSSGPMGCYAILFLLMAVAVDLGRALLFREDMLVQAAFAFVASFLCNIGYLLVLVIRLPMPSIGEALTRSLLMSFLTASAMPLFTLIFSRLIRLERTVRGGRLTAR
ncbi:MAG: rod shape-determining protein MreD [Planctomycetes bacterium RBG_16_59_8]|nr:MAG: rod shape-determining protein MreD [Planctomycetes bacterium RBG_16_59_8]